MSSRDENLVSVQVLKKFRVIYGAVRQHYRDIEQTCGVSGSQLWLMQEIARQQEIGVSELAVRMSIHQSTCSQLVEKLVLRKLVLKERSAVDQRRVGLQLTREGLKVLKKAPLPAEGLLPQALEGLPVTTLRLLNSSLDKLIGQLRIKDVKMADKPLADL